MNLGRTVVLALGIAALAFAATALAATGDLESKGCIHNFGSGDQDCAPTSDGLNGAFSVAVSPDGKSVYVASNLSDAVVRFNRNVDTGSLTPKGCVADNDTGDLDCAQTADGLNGATGVAVSGDGTSVYVASRDDDAIVRLNRDTATGALTPRGCVQDNDTGADGCAQSTDGLNSVRSVAGSADGKSVYAASFDDDAVVRFNRATNGALTPRGCAQDNDTGTDSCTQSADGLDGATSVAVSGDGKSLYAASLLNHAVARFARATTNGAITSKGCVDDNDSGTDTCAQSTDGLAGAHAVAVSADGLSVYAVSGTDNALVRFNRSATNGALTPRGCIDDTTGPDLCSQSTPGLSVGSGVAVSDDGQSVYAVSLGDSAIVQVSRNPTNGAIGPVTCFDDPDAGFDTCPQNADGLQSVTGVDVSADGKSVYTAAQVDQAIARFNRTVP